ncbi:hypothetical protein J2R96_008378 [Bradyrhizobium elkanii]|nr:hypothetical protein [Bradyrhizobium elkanii]
MPIYLVRTIKNKDLVGIFAAPNVMELAFLIDEALDPDACEYQRLPPGGIMWEEKAVAIPIEPGDEAEDDEEEDEGKSDIPWEGARFTEVWAMSVYGVGKGSRWTKIDLTLEDMYGIDPETPEPEPPPKPVRPKQSARVLPFRRREAK